MNILRQTITLTTKDQLNYYNKIIKKSFYVDKPNMILFSFLLDKNCIGYGGLVHIDWDLKRAEISFINNTNRSKTKIIYQKDLSIFLKLISNVAFSDLKLNDLLAQVGLPEANIISHDHIEDGTSVVPSPIEAAAINTTDGPQVS